MEQRRKRHGDMSQQSRSKCKKMRTSVAYSQHPL
jgi:hypothetical protein